VDRTGLFNGLIPITSLAAVALTGTGTITPLGLLAALAVLAGVILGLGRHRKSLPAPGRGHELSSASSTWMVRRDGNLPDSVMVSNSQ